MSAPAMPAGPWTLYQNAASAGTSEAPAAAAGSPAAAAVGAPAAAPAGPWTQFQTAAPETAPSAAAPPPETLGRAAGLGLRALWQGAGSMLGSTDGALIRGVDAVPAVLGDAVMGKFGKAGSAIKDAVAGPAPTPYAGPELSDFVHPSRWQQAAEYFANKAGLPVPVTPGEKIASAAVGALPGLALMGEDPAADAADAPAAASALGRVGGAIKSAVAPLLATSGSAAASEAVRQDGGTPGEQLAAGLGVGFSPTALDLAAMGARGVARGGFIGGLRAGARIGDADAAGTTLTAGQATGNRVLQRLEGASSKIWGGGPLNALVEAQNAHVGNTVRNIAESLAGDVEPTATNAGEAINAGAAATKASMRAAEKAAYDRVDSLVHPQTPVDVRGTLARLTELGTPTPGAEATTGALIPREISAMRDNLTADAGPTGTLPYDAARALRTAVGNSIDWGFAPADPVKNGALKAVYGSLTKDLNSAASAAGPEAAEAVRAANTLHQSNALQSDLLASVVNKAGGPEAVYNAAMSGSKAGATRVKAVMSALDPEQRNLFRATVLGKFGLVPPSGQGATGDVFRLDSFLTHWNQLSPEAKDAIFGDGGAPNSVRRSLDAIARTAANIRGNTVFKNPSGTGEAFAHSFSLMDGLKKLGETAVAIGGGDYAIGHPLVSAASGVGGVAANWGLARLLTQPWFGKWLAASSRIPATALPAAVTALQRQSMARRSADGLAVSHALAAQLAQRGRR